MRDWIKSECGSRKFRIKSVKFFELARKKLVGQAILFCTAADCERICIAFAFVRVAIVAHRHKARISRCAQKCVEATQ